MDPFSLDVIAATVCSVEKQLALLTALLSALLTTLIVGFAVAAVLACKSSLQEKRNSDLLPLKSPVQANSKDRGLMVLHRGGSSHALQSDFSHLSQEQVTCTTSITTMPVQRVSTDRGELVAS